MEHLLINSVKRHITLSDEEADLILSLCNSVPYKKGHFIVREGDVSRNAIFILQGCARAYFIDINGQEHVIQLGIEGWWLGDLASFTHQTPGKLYVEAIEESLICLIPFEHLQDLYSKMPALERYFRILFQHAFIGFHNRILQNLSMDAEQRYLSFREQYPGMDQRIPQKHIASYLGMSAEFLSKVKKRIMLKARTQIS